MVLITIMHSILYFFIIGLLSFFQEKNEFEAEISTWHQNKKGAISISFDDAGYTQYTYAYPILEKYNMKATFSVVGEWTQEKPSFSAELGSFEIKKMGWQQIIELHRHGHEIAAHGYKHQRYNRFSTIPELVTKMKKIKHLIENKIHAPIYTLHYPYSFISDSIIRATEVAGFLFGRAGKTKNLFVNAKTPQNFYLLVSNPILNDTTPSINGFINWTKQANGNWLIIMYHHLFPKNSKEMSIMNYHHVTNTYSLFPETFEKQMKLIANSEYWVAPIADVGKYIIERENTTLTLNMINTNTLAINSKTLLDTTIYNFPLTLTIKLPWNKIQVTGSASDGNYKVSDNQLILYFLPKQTIIITKK